MSTKPEGVEESDEVKILWDCMIQCDKMIEHRKPDIVVVIKKERKCMIIDIAIPGDVRVVNKEEEKVIKYQELKHEIARMWAMTKVDIIPVVVGALGAVTKKLEGWIDKLSLRISTQHLQKTALLGTARILRQVLNS